MQPAQHTDHTNSQLITLYTNALYLKYILLVTTRDALIKAASTIPRTLSLIKRPALRYNYLLYTELCNN